MTSFRTMPRLNTILVFGCFMTCFSSLLLDESNLIAQEQEPIRVLIIDGRNNHAWEATTLSLKQTLNQSGRFKVDVATAPVAYSHQKSPPRRPGNKATQAEKNAYEAELKTWRKAERAYNESNKDKWKSWRPKFSDYHVILNNYNGPSWGEQTNSDFVDFVKSGGGLVNIHAANNAFSDWLEFNQMIGLGWRNSHQGTRLMVDDATGAAVRVESGEGINSGHGSKHPFVVKSRHASHRIMKGLPIEWFHANDELYHGMRGPAANIDILLSAFSNEKKGGTGKHEPILWVTKFGDGRVVTNTMGHIWVGKQKNGNYPVHCVGFQTLLIRTVEWAATGNTTVDVPEVFPTKQELSIVHPQEVQWTFAGKSLLEAVDAIADPKEPVELKK